MNSNSLELETPAHFDGVRVRRIVGRAFRAYTGKDKRLIRPEPQVVFPYDVSNLENGQLAK